MSRKRSYLTVTDQFCGAGGSSLGAVRAGLEVRLALNHWKLAIETHNTNFPDTDHECTDISAADPRRYGSTDVLITSPECTTHSPAGGSRRSLPQRDIFLADDASVARSRATAWDVPRFAEYHDYRLIIVENVVQFADWMLFPEWLATMAKLGYAHRVVSINSMFCHPTPQSRDRIYIVFWKVGNKAPQLDFTPPAWCPKCARVVNAVQLWKPGRSYGKYKQQYLYGCPGCLTVVAPYYFAALNALDLSIAATRIGDRTRALKPRTLDRIRFGLAKYGHTALVVRTNMTTDGGRVRPLDRELHAQTASWLDGLMTPPGFVVETSYTHSPEGRVRGFDDPTTAVTAQCSAALVQMPFLVNGQGSRRVYGVEDALSAQTASCPHDAVVVPPAALVANRSHNTPRSLADAIPTIATGGHQMLVQGAALLTLRDTRSNNAAKSLDEATSAMCAQGPHHALVSPTPFLVSQDRTSRAKSVADPVPSITCLERHELVQPEGTEPLAVEDCFFRMLQPAEIGRAMAFPDRYTVLGSKRDQVRQYGNAVTPPAMDWLIRRGVESLA